MSVWVLIAVCINQPWVGQTTVDSDVLVFESAADCLRNIPHVEEVLHKSYSQVYTRCAEKKVVPENKQ